MIDIQKKGFSWKRVGLVVDYYLPTLRKQIILYPAAIAAMFLIVYACQFMGDVMAEASVAIMGASSFMLYWAPLILCRHDDRVVVTQLPVTAAEKWTVLVGYFFVVIPILVYGLIYALSGLVMWLTPEYEFYISMYHKLPNLGHIVVTTRFIELLPAALCLWGALHFKTNRALMSMLTSAAVLVINGVLGGVWGMILAFRQGFNDAVAGKDLITDSDEIVSHVSQTMSVFLEWMGVACAIAFIVMLVLIYRKLKNIQI